MSRDDIKKKTRGGKTIGNQMVQDQAGLNETKLEETIKAEIELDHTGKHQLY